MGAHNGKNNNVNRCISQMGLAARYRGAARYYGRDPSLYPMADFIELLTIYPILENLAECLKLGDLLNLGRTNSIVRAVCRGLDATASQQDYVADTNVRRSLLLGAGNTNIWRHLKSAARLECSENNHTKGGSPQGCLACSMPVCLACIVKNSFTKNENTFQSRCRPLCRRCFAMGNPHAERIRFCGDSAVKVDYTENGICQCTARDGILCLQCKMVQNDTFSDDILHCAGFGCGIQLTGANMAGRVCLWCKLILPGPRSVERHRRFYESRNLFDRDSETLTTRAVKAGPAEL